jgi:hypothetical protein
VQVGVAPLQTWPQPPQLCGSFVTLTSQPSFDTPSQSANPALHAWMTQAALVQAVALTFGPFAQMWPHPPQLFTLVVTLVSQPSLATPLQSAHPELQPAMTHAAAEQAGTLFGAFAQTWPHMPQLFKSVEMFVGQPAMGIPVQLANPAWQLPLHVPMLQVAVLLGPVMQAMPHPPQLFVSEARLTQDPAQVVSPGMHADMASALPSGSFGKSTPTDALPLRCISMVTATGGWTVTFALTLWTPTQLGTLIGVTIAQWPEYAAAENESLPRGRPFSAKTLDEPATASNE